VGYVGGSSLRKDLRRRQFRITRIPARAAAPPRAGRLCSSAPASFHPSIRVISELSRALSLSMRLFGNMMSGHLIVALLVALTGFLVPMPLMALDVLIGLLQA
jgi:F0F1-type ATP synthase membrane subunit a